MKLKSIFKKQADSCPPTTLPHPKNIQFEQLVTALRDQMSAGEEDSGDYLCVRVPGKEDQKIYYSLSFKDSIQETNYKLYGINIDCPNYFGGVAFGDEKWIISQIVRVYWATVQKEDAAKVLIGGFIIDDDTENAETNLNILVYDLTTSSNPGVQGVRDPKSKFQFVHITFQSLFCDI